MIVNNEFGKNVKGRNNVLAIAWKGWRKSFSLKTIVVPEEMRTEHLLKYKSGALLRVATC
jgi:hypothetical protein